MQSNSQIFQNSLTVPPQIQNTSNIGLTYPMMWPYQIYQPQLIPTYNYQASQFYFPSQIIQPPYAFYPGFPNNQISQPQNCLNQPEMKQEQDEQQLLYNRKQISKEIIAKTIRQMKESDSESQQKKPQIKKTKNRIGHWKNEEHYLYLKFVRKNEDLFKTSARKKLNRVFKLMSLEIPTRTPCQCRSHFSKFNPFDQKEKKIRRKLMNDEKAYERMFSDQLYENE